MSNYFDLQNSPVLTTPSDLTAPKITSIGYPGDDTAADPAGGQTITLTGAGFEAGASVIVNGNAVGVVSVVSNTTITFTSPAQSAGSYVLYVVNTDGGTAIAVPGIQYSGTPNWTTAAGTLGSYTETQAIANTVTATGDAPITYSVFSGSLPTGATLNSANGYISGTSPAAASPTTYTFTIRATDAEQQDTNRQFSLTINPDVVTWSTPANGTTYTSFANSAISNVALSATAASGQNVSYSANALPTGLSISGSNITGTPTVVANSSTLLTATAATTNATATRTINWVISVANDTYFPYVTSLLSASTPTSTFVTDASTNGFAVTVFGDAKPSNFGPYTPGYYSGFFDGNGDYLTLTYDATAFDWWTTNYTIEAWIYPTTLTGWFYVDGGTVNKGTLIGSNSFNSTGNNWSLGLNSAGNLWWAYYTGANQGGGTSNTVTLNAWNHVAMVVNGTNITLYLNGVGTSLGNIVGTPTSGSPLTIGAGNNTYINGYVSNLRIVKGTAVYTTNFTPSTVPLTAIANTQLLTCQSNRFIDNSTNNFTITRNGDTLISGFDPFTPSSSYTGYGSGYFSATSAYGRVAMAGADSFGTGDFTVECWLYPSNSAINISMPSVATNSWAILTYGSQLYWQENGGNLGGAGYGTVPLNTWTHLAVARSGSTIRLFVNGVQVYSASNTFNYSGAPATRTIGPGEGGGIPAYIGDFRIVKGTAVYTTAFTPPATPLTAIANTSLLTLQNNQPNNNSMFLDSSTNNFNITRNGNTTQGSFSPYGGGWSNYFDGNGDYLSLSSNSAFDITSGDFTVEMWIYRTAGGAEQYLWSNRADAPARGWEWRINSTNLMQFFFTGGSSLTSTGTVPINAWTHLAVTRQTNTVRFFINGALDSSTAFSNGTAVTTSLFLGYSTSGGGYLTGYMSNARLVKGTAIYTSAFTPSTTPLTPIANTQLLTCADNRFIDDSANNFTITRNGEVNIQRFNPWNPVITTPTSYSAYFDGTGDFLSLPNNSALNISSGDFTVECWFYVTNSTNTQTLFWLGGNTASYSTIRFGIDTNALALYFGADSTSWAINQQGLGSVAAFTWYHAAVSRSGSSIRVFLNGTQVGSTITSSATFYAGSLYYLGALNYTDGGFPSYRVLTGYISNARVVKGTALYTSNFTPSTTPLTAVANTSLLTLQSPTFIDNSTNNFAITNNGDTAPRQFNPFGWTTTTGSTAAYTPALYGGSGYFDGTGDYLSVPASTFSSTGNFTAEAWVYATSTSTAPVFYLGGDGDSYAGLRLQITGDGNFYLLMTTAYGSWTINSGNIGSTPRNTWIHVAVVRSAGNVFVFQNGVSIYTSTALSAASTLYASSNYLIAAGASNLGTGINAFFAGYISDARITKGVARYTSNFAPPVAPLTALQNTTLLANMTGAGIYDSAMIATYETAGNASISTSIKKYGNTSIAFDGSGDALASPANINLAVGSGDFTIEMWVNGANNGSAVGGSFPRLFTLGTAQGSGCIESYNASGTMYVDISGAGGPISFTASTLLNSTWNHYAITRSGTSLRAFVNGTQVGTTATNSTNINLAATTQSWIGAISASAGNFNGYIDDLRITKGVARYTSNFTPTSTPFLTN